MRRAMARRRLGRDVERHAHVHGDRAVAAREYRIEVELGDLREVADERANIFDEARDSGTVDRGTAPHTVEKFRAANFAQHRSRVVRAGRCQPKRDVAHHFDEHAAEAERRELAEHRIRDGTDDQLGTTGQHLLYHDAVNVAVRRVATRGTDDAVECTPRVGIVADGEHHPTDVRLVHDIRRLDLHRHRIADAARDRDRRLRGGGEIQRCEREIVGRADVARLERGDPAATRCRRRIEDPPYVCPIVTHASPPFRRLPASEG